QAIQRAPTSTASPRAPTSNQNGSLAGNRRASRAAKPQIAAYMHRRSPRSNVQGPKSVQLLPYLGLWTSGFWNMSESWTVLRLLTWTTDYLKSNGSDSPRLDAEVLLAHALACERIKLY